MSEEEVTEALDHLEKQLGFTLTGPVRELVSTRIVNVLSKSLGVIGATSRVWTSSTISCRATPRSRWSG